jgi:hypothetical protein
MMLNLFSYPSNYGYIEIFKCDYFGGSLSSPRNALIDGISVNVDQAVVEDRLLFGGFDQINYTMLGQRKINISADFLFANNVAGTLDPAIDLLFNLSAWSYQGTAAPFKFTKNDGTNPSNTTPVNEYLMYQNLFQTPSGLTSGYKYFQISENGIAVEVNELPDPMPVTGWVDVFKYGTDIETFPLQYEPMFRINCAEGSFYPCMVNKISLSIDQDYIKIKCDIVSLNYSRADRYEFINASSINLSKMPIVPLHRSRVLISDFVNDITSTFDVTDLNRLDYMDGLMTQSFNAVPIKEFSLNIDNGLEVIHTNIAQKMQRTFAVGYYSKQRKINGTMSVLALRSSQPTFDRYPVLNSSTRKSLSLNFNNQIYNIPYTVWNPGKVEVKQGDYVNLQFNWTAVTRERQGQPLFEMERGNNE